MAGISVSTASMSTNSFRPKKVTAIKRELTIIPLVLITVDPSQVLGTHLEKNNLIYTKLSH